MLDSAIAAFNDPDNTCSVIEVGASFDVSGPIAPIADDLDAFLGVDKNLTINGNGEVVHGDGESAGFVVVLSDLTRTVTIDNLGFTNFGGTGAFSVLQGNLDVRRTRFVGNSFMVPELESASIGATAGAINAVGALTIIDSEFIDNSGDLGGAVHSASAESTVIVTGTTFFDNEADSTGGAMYVSGPLSMRNSTVTGNAAPSAGGLNVVGAVDIDFSTIVDNTSYFDNGGVTSADAITVRRSILHNNLSNTDSGSPEARDIVGQDTIDVSDSLLTSQSSMTLWAPSTLAVDSVIYGDPLLGPMRNNGGFVLPGNAVIGTRAPRAGSPVISAIQPVGAGVAREEFDQRGAGFPRFADDAAEMGAVEYRLTSRPPAIDWDHYLEREPMALPDTR